MKHGEWKKKKIFLKEWNKDFAKDFPRHMRETHNNWKKMHHIPMQRYRAIL
jgi:hypothetical protein